MKTTVYRPVIVTAAILLLGVLWTCYYPQRPRESGLESQQDPQTAAMLLAQHPDMKRVLIVGQGQTLADAFLLSEAIEAVDWIGSPGNSPVPSETRLNPVTDSLETWLGQHPESYDAIIVNLPTPWHPRFGQWTTESVCALFSEALTFNGILAVGLPEDQDYWAAVTQQTLARNFLQTLLIGEGRFWFLGTKSIHLETIASRLRLRFERLENAEQICDPNALERIYDYQVYRARMDRLAQVTIPAAQLVNRDAQQTRWQAQQVRFWQACGDRDLKVLQTLQRIDFSVAIGSTALALFLCQAVVRLRERRKQGPWHLEVGRLEALTLPLVGGAIAGMVLAGHLMGRAIDATVWRLGLFILGGAVGGFRMQQWTRRSQNGGVFVWWLLNGVILAQGGLLALPLERIAGLNLFLSGLFLGTYSMAGILERQKSQGDWSMASIGIALGLMIWTWVTPQIIAVAWWLLGLALTLRLLSWIPLRTAPADASAWRHALAVILATIGLSVLFMTQYDRWTQSGQGDDDSIVAAHALVSQGNLVARQAELGDGEVLNYWEVTQGLQRKGYVFASQDLCEPVYGYGGPVELMAYVDPEGNLLDYRLTRSNETPRYLDSISGWMQSLKGQVVFGQGALANVDTVSGATFSTRAIRSLLIQAGQRFAREVLQWQDDGSTQTASPWHQVATDQRVLALLTALLLALVAMCWDSHWLRMAWLALIMIAMGWWLNVQVSTDHVMPLLHGDWPVWQQGLSWLLTLGVPLMILLLGNIYCGYLCPFGALQELLSLIIPRRWQPGRNTQRWARLIKYVILTTWAVVYLLREDKAVYRHDPLLGFFSTPLREILLSPWTGLLLVAVLIFPRFWCRTLCPTGAFLSLFNLGAWLGRWLPVKKYGQCEFGLTGRDHLDCIGCDRCRHRQTAVTAPKSNKWPDRWYLGLAMVLAIWLLIDSLRGLN